MGDSSCGRQPGGNYQAVKNSLNKPSTLYVVARHRCLRSSLTKVEKKNPIKYFCPGFTQPRAIKGHSLKSPVIEYIRNCDGTTGAWLESVR